VTTPGTWIRLAAALLVAVLTGPFLRADMTAPWEARAVPTYRITVDDPFPDYVLVVYRHVTLYTRESGSIRETPQSADVAEFMDLAPGKSVSVTHPPATAELVSVYIVPRAAAAPYPTALDLGKAVIEGRVEGAARYDLPLRESGPAWMGSRIVLDYRVRRAEGGPTLVRTTPDQWYQCWVVGLGVPLAVAVGGLWLIRRARRVRRA
jgi:hypothetical protein